MCYSREQAQLICDVLNRVTASLVKRLKEAGTFEKNFRRGGNKNFTKFIKNMEKCLSGRKTVQVMRFDAHIGEIRQERQSLVYRNELAKLPRFLDWKAQLQEYLNFRYRDALLGFAWRLELGASRSWHLHYLVLLEPSLHPDGAFEIDDIAETWHSLTDGEGEIFNVNKDRAGGYKSSCLGIIETSDMRALRGLVNVAAYFTLPDLYLRLVLPGGNTFGEGKFRSLEGRRIPNWQAVKLPVDTVSSRFSAF